MNVANIILPLDLTKCAVDALRLVNRFNERTDIRVILLNVVNLNVVGADNRVYEDLRRHSAECLERLAREFVLPGVELRLRTRLGRPSEEILAEAREQKARLILLPVFAAPFWKRALRALRPSVAERLAQDAGCPVFVVPAKVNMDCAGQWGFPERSNDHAAKGSLASLPWPAAVPGHA